MTTPLLRQALLVVFLTGCSDTDVKLSGPAHSFTIIALPWQLSVTQDGSGTIIYGAGGMDLVQLPPGTFDFANCRDRVVETGRMRKAENRGAKRRAAFTVSMRLIDKTHTIFYTQDTALVKSMIENGIDSAMERRVFGSQRIHELWTANPIKS